MREFGSVVSYFSQAGLPRGDRDALGALTNLLSHDDVDESDFRALVERFGVGRDEWFRKGVLDLILGFVEQMVADGQLSPEELEAIQALKSFLHVREGEFIKLRPIETATILTAQLENLLADLTIDSAEDLEQGRLQRVFDLSYDQYLALTRRAMESAMGELQQSLQMAELNGDKVRFAELSVKARALEPNFRLAIAQPRTLGARY